MATAQLLAEGLSQFCPTTNHYLCSDGTYLLVTVPTFDPADLLAGTLGISIAPLADQMPTDVDVFLSDENALAIDADTGDVAMTPLHTFSDVTTHAEALARAGYQLEAAS